VTSLEPARPSPQSVTTPITWRSVATGGVGQLVFDFEIRRSGGPVQKEQSGPNRSWDWTPRETGRYEVRVLVRDSLGNDAASGWSEPYEVEPPLIAILPFENLSAIPAPHKEMRAALLERLRRRGVKMLGEEELLALMARLRIRYTGGVDGQMAEAFRREAGVGAVLITSLELYSAQAPPKVAIVSRLASTEPHSIVVWADSVSLSGDDAPGFLGLGLVEDVKKLTPIALDRLADSLASHLLSGSQPMPARWSQSRFRPRGLYRSPRLDGVKRYSITVLPVVNHSLRKNAGEILAGIMIEQLAKAEGIEVLEPGMVRDELLRYRIVAPEGASLDAADLLFDRLKVDLLLTGKVMDYDDARGTGGVPQVTFFVQIIERNSKEVVWASHSTNRGNEGVFFFNAGEVKTAHALASMMAENVVQRFLGSGASPAKIADEARGISP
jgi:TolB-like protein